MDLISYKQLAERLNSLPNGFPATGDGRELMLLAKIFTPEEAELASQLTSAWESVEEIAARTGRDAADLRKQLKQMARGGLIEVGRKDGALAFMLMPFVVGIYEMQVNRMDAELARLFEDYFQSAFGEMLAVKPQFHRVIPVKETIRNTMEVHPFESAVEIVDAMQSWGVLDCICRKQKALLGQACEHPIDVCMAMDPRPDAFAGSPVIRAITRDQALETLQRAADAGLVHTVSNNQEGLHYVCNCCTCSCGILRGMAELGIANVVARSAFVNQVDELLCSGCEACISSCQFEALSMDGPLVKVAAVRCVGCGVCVIACSAGALSLARRPEEEVLQVPVNHTDWNTQRSAARGF